MRTYHIENGRYLLEASELLPFPMIFIPHHKIDKWNNDVSTVMFPDMNATMVHHSPKYRKFQSATIYVGRDEFVKFSSYQSEIDTEMHTVSMRCTLGEFSLAWGDGDLLGLDLPVGMNEKLTSEQRAFLGHVVDISDSNSEEHEVAFIMGMLQFFRMQKEPVWFSKATWEPVKQQLQEIRSNKKAMAGY